MSANSSYRREVARGGVSGEDLDGVAPLTDLVRGAANVKAIETRRRLVRSRDRQQILETARQAAAIGEGVLAFGLYVDLLTEESADTFRLRRPYRPGDVMRSVLGALTIDIDTSWRVYRGILMDLLPEDWTRFVYNSETPRSLISQDLSPVHPEEEIAAAAHAILSGESYESALERLISVLELESARARERELDWLTSRLQLRFAPAENGLGRLWAGAAERVSHGPAPGDVLSRAATERVVVRLVSARNPDEIAAALAAGLEEPALTVEML